MLGLAVLLALAVAYAVQHFWFGRPEAVQIPAASPTVRAGPELPAGPARPGQSAEPAQSGQPAGTAGQPGSPGGGGVVVVVDIAGKVQTPGVRALPGGSRVADALRAAGGALPDTDTSALNLARVLTDGEQILVGGPPPPPGAGPTTRSPVSLNRATTEQLDALPGVGPTLAQRIVAYREAHGGFRSLDQLRQVSGIGDRTYAELKPLLVL
ncbi:ComEA family DNA-binding protein [Kitasatospora sp. NBC_00240]|uniref:ComEA family DNA-binding protein n=1 Tax=Kitasatospora sp. NBC_00240 TaxID=2903567 RepID=UPI00224F46D9|nr:ComEA family DNA-binding protein [Kitasatospora sp. NBC_00240]MCX5212971.1 ComEA family DNA-binding protein [Kitasatospora sp. NBC_00240]